MRQDREQKNVIYKASADWNLSSDPLAAAQLICSWFQTTPPGRPEGTFFRFYAWIYLFNSPFTKTTADDSTNQSLWRKQRTHSLTQAHTRYPGSREPPSLLRTGLFGPGGSGKEEILKLKLPSPVEIPCPNNWHAQLEQKEIVSLYWGFIATVTFPILKRHP